MDKALCPRCKVDLHRRSTKNVLQYFCQSCMGFAVHWGDVQKVIGYEEFIKMKSTIEHSSDAPTNCSHCQRKMKTYFHSEAGLEVDICVDCRLIWLDTGEWYDLSKATIQKEIDPEKKIYARPLLDLSKENDLLRRENLGEYVDTESLSGPKFAAAVAGIPVEEDSATKNPEWLTASIIVIAVLIFLNYRNILFPENTSSKWVNHLFASGGNIYAVLNIYLFWIFGARVEEDLGKISYLVLVGLATVGGVLMSGILNYRSLPLIGASGAVSAVIAYYLLVFPKKSFVFHNWLWSSLSFFRERGVVVNASEIGWRSLPGYVLGMLYVLKELMAASISGFVHIAHLLSGVALGLFFARRRLARSEDKKE